MQRVYISRPRSRAFTALAMGPSAGVGMGGVQQVETAHILSCSALFFSTALITH